MVFYIQRKYSADGPVPGQTSQPTNRSGVKFRDSNQLNFSIQIVGSGEGELELNGIARHALNSVEFVISNASCIQKGPEGGRIGKINLRDLHLYEQHFVPCVEPHQRSNLECTAVAAKA